MATQPPHKLTYFGFTPGRALPIRLAFYIGLVAPRSLAAML